MFAEDVPAPERLTSNGPTPSDPPDCIETVLSYGLRCALLAERHYAAGNGSAARVLFDDAVSAYVEVRRRVSVEMKSLAGQEQALLTRLQQQLDHFKHGKSA